MKKIFSMLIIALFVFACSEDDVFVESLDQVALVVEAVPEGERSGDEVFMVVEEMPEFPGGKEAFTKFQLTNLKYPKEAITSNAEGKVVLNFIVTKEGKVDDIIVMRGIGYGCDEEAVKLMLNSPDWKPGKQRGRLVNTRMTMAINFKMAGSDYKPAEGAVAVAYN